MSDRDFELFLAGFENSGEGWNGEYPPPTEAEVRERYERWRANNPQMQPKETGFGKVTPEDLRTLWEIAGAAYTWHQYPGYPGESHEWFAKHFKDLEWILRHIAAKITEPENE